jgi:hypothetical protein
VNHERDLILQSTVSFRVDAILWPSKLPITTAQGELAAAAMIHPESAIVSSPAISFPAGRPADLAGEPHAISCIDLAVMAASVIRGAGHGSQGSRSAIGPAAVSELELGTAATIDPHAPAIGAPGFTLPACRPADLTGEPYSVAGIGIAIVPPAVVGRTG